MKNKKTTPTKAPAFLFYILLAETHEQRLGGGPYNFKRFDDYDEACRVAKLCAVQYGVRMNVLGQITAFEQEQPKVVEVPHPGAPKDESATHDPELLLCSACDGDGWTGWSEISGESCDQCDGTGVVQIDGES